MYHVFLPNLMMYLSVRRYTVGMYMGSSSLGTLGHSRVKTFIYSNVLQVLPRSLLLPVVWQSVC
jgi:hypothetical protein